MTTDATISSSVLHGLREDVARLAVDERELARHCRLPDVEIFRTEIEIPLEGFVSVLEFVADTGNCHEFGWEAGKFYNIDYLGDLGATVSCAPTLGTALQIFARYLRLIQSTSEMTFEIDGSQLVMNYRILDPDIWPRRQDAEFTISVLCSIMRRCVGRDWTPLYIGFEHQSSNHPGTRNDELEVACEYGCDCNTIVLPVQALDAPMPAHCHGDWQTAAARLNRAVRKRDRSRPIHYRVRSAILSELGRSALCQSAIADKLGLSQRTLHRRLEAEGTCYRAILSDCRSRLSRFLLINRDRPLSEIAYDLGYSDYTAFSRAFRTGFGRTPKAFRDDPGA